VIAEEMEALGASLEGGVWQYDGEPVEIIVLIRTEDERRDIGDYVANQLEEVGFTTFRDYRPAADASPIWLFKLTPMMVCSMSTPVAGSLPWYRATWLTTSNSSTPNVVADYHCAGIHP
jgi:peptide/nickel transport system substrate-binding protein